MLSQLDTLIGFVVVMSIVSLMVMIANQIASDLLGLRGKNLHDAIATLFYQLAPKLDAEARSHLIDATLINPIISDTIMSTSKAEGFLQRSIPWLRRMRTACSRATAIRPDELLSLLDSKATSPIANMLELLEKIHTALTALDAGPPRAIQALEKVLPPVPVPETQPNSVTAALAEMNKTPETDGPTASTTTPNQKPTAKKPTALDVTKDVAMALYEFRTALAHPPTTLSPEALASLRALEAQIDQVVAEFDSVMATIKSNAQRRVVFAVAYAARKVVTVVRAGQKITTEETDRFEKWFNSAQDRAQQWFAMHMRIVTVIISVIAAFVLQLDTFKVIHLLATNPDIRAKLVAQAEGLAQQQQSITQRLFTAPMHDAALKMIAADHPTWQLPSAPLPLGLDVTGAEKWFAQQLELKPSPDNTEILMAYEQAVLRQQLDRNVDSFRTLARETNQSALQLMPSPYPIVLNAWPKPHWYTPFTLWIDDGSGARTYWSWPLSHLFGILVSAALLGLGAPFWFSLLKNLTALRPALAQAIDDNPKRPTSDELATNQQN